MPEVAERSVSTLRFPALGADAHLEQYLGAWALHDAQGMYRLVARMDMAAHVDRSRADSRERGERGARRASYEIATAAGPSGAATSIAIIEVRGMLTKYGSSVGEPNGMLRLRQVVRKAAADESIGGILLVIDSPGGTVSGTKDFADDIAKAAQRKPVHAYIEDLGASAAYWIASQCSRVSCNASAIVGAIGTYAVVEDSSKAAADAGITVHVVRAGEMKGAGEPGTEVTEEQLAHWQRMVDTQNDFFVKGVAFGRGMSLEVAGGVADGRVHVGAQALELGLVDAVEDFDAAVSALVSAPRGSGTGARALMSATAENANNDAGAVALEEAKEAQVMSATTTTAKKGRAAIKAETAKSEGDGGEDGEDEEIETGAEAPKKAEPSSRGPAAPAAATITELKAAIPDSTAEFRETCMEQGLTVAQAKGIWAAQPKATAKDEPQNKRYGSPGVSAGIGSGKQSARAATGSAIADFDERVREEMNTRKCSRMTAVQSVAAADPELHKAYLMETNPGRRQRNDIENKFDDR